MTTAEIIRDLVGKHGKLPVDVATLGDDSDLYTAGLSSFASVQLMLALEEQFDIEFPETMLKRATFASIRAIADAVDSIVRDQAAA
ncbi:acyl carrier protein [Stappia sp. F7233]|uniref:Acyl carrier protein n=1 Tax=Stappia albiluteola TaxID=2758565 RepID=A0A839AA67_9HYPH|nr:acyl carrier protein [Stappia albiluteola]MBA5775924.1 acyl carrier protein [Stappia albiluteola]